jgi:DeoR family transcriptional regulator, suf operon transcriptional repressor
MAPEPHPALTALPTAKRAILNVLKKRGEATVDEIAEALEITVSGARQQMAGLQRDGLVSVREQRMGPGRPRHYYSLTPAGDSLYPRAYAELTNELLDYVADEDPELLETIFERRRARRLERARERLEGRSFEERIELLTRILDEDGYLADHQRLEDGSFVVTEHNCAVLGVAVRYGQACSSEIDFIRQVLPDASVERTAHMVAGAHMCAYKIQFSPQNMSPTDAFRSTES